MRANSNINDKFCDLSLSGGRELSSVPAIYNCGQ